MSFSFILYYMYIYIYIFDGKNIPACLLLLFYCYILALYFNEKQQRMTHIVNINIKYQLTRQRLNKFA